MWFDGWVREFGKIDVTEIAKAVTEVPDEIWASDWRRKRLSNFQHTESLHFMWSPFLYDKFSVYDKRDRWEESNFGRLALDTLEQIRALIPGRLVRAMLTRLYPGLDIKPHFDGIHPIYTECHRIHLPLITEPEVEFHFTDEHTFHMPVGTVAEINNMKVHSVTHGGKELRYHFVLDLLPDSYPGDLPVEYHTDYQRYLAETNAQDLNKWFPKLDTWQEHYDVEVAKWKARSNG